MLRTTLNLGILAHVDAGKTTLTERLLFAAGVIERLGSVDAGTTQTDSLALERQRGITIKSAVASFGIGDVTVNLIDTPGHPDFIAEVERVLSVLDGAVLVISAVEGVQPQTRILMRSLQRLGIPALLFVNKIDRVGADPERVLRQVRDRLGLHAVAMTPITGAGTRAADATAAGQSNAEFQLALTELLADQDDALLAAYLAGDGAVTYPRLRRELATQVRRGLVHPVYFGSALTGAGVAALTSGVAELLPAAAGDPDGAIAGQVFKIERDDRGEKVAYIRLFSGTVHVRDRLHWGNGQDGRVTAVAVFDRGPAATGTSVSAGQIGKLRGLAEIQIGDQVGAAMPGRGGGQFPPPTLESVVVACDPADRGRLHTALRQIAEQDPLINLRRSDDQQEISVSLYGEVQKEVIQATLAADFGIGAAFRQTTTIYIERPARPGRALAELTSDDHPYSATIGLTLTPGRAGSGVVVRLDVDPRTLPLYIYKNADRFAAAMSGYVQDALLTGPHGWEVTDCLVTMTRCGYYIGDGPTKQELPTPRTTAADFRKLTPLVLRQALEQAGTVVCEPMARLRLEIPADCLGAVLAALARLSAGVGAPALHGDLAVVQARLVTADVQELQHQLPSLTGGEGLAESSFGGYRPVRGEIPVRTAAGREQMS